ncbi:MAG TPA: M20/M25/M40 family metallo-hydrolase, partial [Thermoanaerobaculia bacterium]|nr:M20/M25/M40 family metallo-hydrolase [Thermoanaerobaculia bacterium]
MAYGLVERRRRAAARLALYGSLVLVGAATLFARYYLHLPLRGGPESAWLSVDWQAQTAVRLLQQYLRIDTTDATGDELAAALFLSTPLEAAGFDVHVERVGDHHANLWAELLGDDPRALVLLSHLDVEPVPDPAKWDHPPFAGFLEPPWIYGRGAFDMKSYTVAQLLALLELKAFHPHPRRSVILLVTGGEESGGDLGMRWLLAAHPELATRFWAVLNEGGVVEARNLADVKYWGVEIGQKRFVQVLACASTRRRLEDLQRDIASFDTRPVGIVVDEEVRRFWQDYAPSRDSAPLRQLMADPEQLVHDPQRYLQL